MKTNTPATYNSMTQIYGGSGSLTGYTLPPHRAVLFLASAVVSSGITYQNMDGTTGSFVTGTGAVVLPTQISKIWVNNNTSSIRINTLL